MARIWKFCHAAQGWALGKNTELTTKFGTGIGKWAGFEFRTVVFAIAKKGIRKHFSAPKKVQTSIALLLRTVPRSPLEPRVWQAVLAIRKLFGFPNGIFFYA